MLVLNLVNPTRFWNNRH